MKTKLITFEELKNMVLNNDKVDIDISTRHDFEPEGWINISLIDFNDSKVLLGGGYASDVCLIANEYQLLDEYYHDEVIKNLKDLLENFDINIEKELICIEI